MYKKLQISALSVLILSACSAPVKDAAEAEVKATLLVTVANPVNHSFSNSIVFNAVTQYQQKSVIRAGITGYLKHRGWKVGDHVSNGEVFCTITSKEQQALKNIDKGGILAKFREPIKVTSGTSGIITAVNFQNGDYVAEGDVLANLVQTSSLVLLVNVPVEYLSKVRSGTACTVMLPDGRQITSHLQAGLPTADPAVQTQSFIVSLGSTNLPEGTNLKVSISLSNSQSGLAVPVTAVQTDETQQHFWVFKLGTDGVAYKVDVQAGKISADSLQEIKSDKLSISDKIIVDGAYGLTDSSKVKISPPTP